MSINIFSCGGAGVNIAKKIKNNNLNKIFIDTSISNLKGVSEDKIFLIEGLDGAGKYRTTTYDKFKHYADDILIKFKASNELNIVISSLSGGSGSVIAPMVVKKLLEDNKNVIVFAIDSRNSIIELENTIKTLMTYKSISNQTNKPVNMFYFDNINRVESDNKCLWGIELFDLLVDKQRTEEFDISDLSNFINFNKVTDNEPNVAFLEVIANEPIIPVKNTVVISSILLTKDHNTSIHPVIPEYLATCIVTDTGFNTDVRLNSIVGSLHNKIEELQSIVKDLNDNKRINKVKDIEVTGSNSDGVVL